MVGLQVVVEMDKGGEWVAEIVGLQVVVKMDKGVVDVLGWAKGCGCLNRVICV